MRILSILLILSGPVLADNNASNCRNLPDKPRLACYDREFGVATTVEPIGKWKISQKISPVTDSAITSISLESENALSCNSGQRATFIMRCRERATNLYLYHSCYAPAEGSSDDKILTIRVDKKQARGTIASASEGSKAIGYWTSYQSLRELKEIVKGESLVMAFKPYGKVQEAAQFDIRGLKETLSKTDTVCGWADIAK